MDEQRYAKDYLIFKCLSGSKAYGTSTLQSDEDIRGIFLAPPEFSMGCLKNIEQVEVSGEDTIIYELKKFIRLAVDANPNIIELLYTEKSNILFIHPAFQRIRDARDLFLSKKAKHTFSGYAMAQLKRIKGHIKWINFPQPVDPPELLDFAKLILPDGTVVPGDSIESFVNVFLVKLNAITFRVYSSPKFSKSSLSDDRHNLQFIDGDGFNPSESTEFYGTLIVQLDTFKIQHRIWKEYWTWKKNRNPARAELEEKFKFDCKHAQHLIRLLRMGREILSGGRVIVRRPDAAELMDIRNGKWNYAEIIAEAERMDRELTELYETSTLPDYPNKEAINRLYIDIVQQYWKLM